MSNDNRRLFAEMLNEKEKLSLVKPPTKDYIRRIDKQLDTFISYIRANDYITKAAYKNSKGIFKELIISAHALNRFEKRLIKIYKKDISDLSYAKLEQLLCYMINNSVKENLNKCITLNKRKNNYDNKDSIYLKIGCFRFVINNMKVITVELRGYYFYLN